jgi:hypothetical protein
MNLCVLFAEFVFSGLDRSFASVTFLLIFLHSSLIFLFLKNLLLIEEETKTSRKERKNSFVALNSSSTKIIEFKSPAMLKDHKKFFIPTLKLSPTLPRDPKSEILRCVALNVKIPQRRVFLLQLLSFTSTALPKLA